MSLHAPFLVKQYLSEDLESGSYSRIFWYYPLDQAKAAQGGIGLFFEVLSGDVDDDVYEQITKRFWESFNDYFYVDGFEQALKRSIKMFIQLLRGFGVEEGLDVNIVLCNVVPTPKGYTLRLISFGDSDIFVVRAGKYADMGKLVPENRSLYDLKFLEVELDKEDILLLGNKTLLRNAFEADMLALTSLEELLRSLESFKENLFGSKKLFLVAAQGEYLENKGATANGILQKAFQLASVAGATAIKVLGKTKEYAQKVVEQAQKKRGQKPEATEIPESDFQQVPSATEETSEPVAAPSAEDAGEDFVLPPEIKPAEPRTTSVIAPPPIQESIVPEEEATESEEPPTEPIIEPPPTSLPRPVAITDFSVAEEVTTSGMIDKSAYQGIVDEAEQEEELAAQKPVTQSLPTPLGHVQQTTPRPLPKDQNYINELRAMHSPWAKISRNPTVRSMITMIRGLLLLGLEKILELFGKKKSQPGKKIFLSKPSSLAPKKVAPGVWLIGGIIIIVGFFWVKGIIQHNALEHQLLTNYQTQANNFIAFYEQSIVPITVDDPDHQLALCPTQGQQVLDLRNQIDKSITSTKGRATLTSIATDIAAKVAACQQKSDKVNGIVRVRDAQLVTDFKVSLGSDSSIASMTLRSGSIVVADRGRRAIYQLNVDTKNITKYDDPLGLITDPLAVGSGEGTLFVCDAANGVLYYNGNAGGNKVGFNRIIGTEPTSIGQCMYVDGFAKNAYIVPNTANSVYRVEANGAGFKLPDKRIKNLAGVQSIGIDGNIYVISNANGKGNVARYYGGSLDNFAIPDSVNLGTITASYTNPSNDRPLYLYDQTKNAVLVIEKPAGNRHPGKGVLIETYQFQNTDKFSNVKAIAIDLNGNNQESNMYVLSGTTIWKFPLSRP